MDTATQRGAPTDEQIAWQVHGECKRLPGATFYNAAQMALGMAEARAALASAAPAPTGQPSERFDLSHTAGFYQAMNERPLIDAEQAWLYRNALQKIGAFDDDTSAASKAATARAALASPVAPEAAPVDVESLADQRGYAKGGAIRAAFIEGYITAAAPRAPGAEPPEGWRKVVADLRLGLAAGGRSISGNDFEIEYGGALLDAVQEKLDALTPKAPAEPAREYKYALNLAIAIYRDSYATKAPEWKPLPDLLGLLTQIDNMVAGLKAEPAGAGLTDAEVDAVIDAHGTLWHAGYGQLTLFARAVLAAQARKAGK